MMVVWVRFEAIRVFPEDLVGFLYFEWNVELSFFEFSLKNPLKQVLFRKSNCDARCMV